MTRGFITIATGKELYYQLAKNLLLSYKLFCDSPYPFAIMCDRKNEYTELFDDVVILEKPLNAFWDKFELLTRAPYDETIFIDADCLAYANLNEYWEYFADAPDFTGCGTNFPIEAKQGIFQLDGIGEYRDRVHWKPHICGGLYFIRRGEMCNALYKECMYICDHYDQFTFADFCVPKGDEPVLSVAMAALGLRAMEADPRNYGITWQASKMEYDIFTGKCIYDADWHPLIPQGRLIHFSTEYCSKPRYIIEVEKLNLMIRQGLKPSKTEPLPLSFRDKLLYQYKLRLYWMLGVEFFWRVIRKLKRILKIA